MAAQQEKAFRRLRQARRMDLVRATENLKAELASGSVMCVVSV